MKVAERKRCLRCGSTEELQHHHVIPRALRRRVGPDYWKLHSSTEFIGCDPPEAFQEAADRWAKLPHYTQRLCPNCHQDVHREIDLLFQRMREAEQFQCQCIKCKFFRNFDLGNLFAWFVPDSPLVA